MFYDPNMLCNKPKKGKLYNKEDMRKAIAEICH